MCIRDSSGLEPLSGDDKRLSTLQQTLADDEASISQLTHDRYVARVIDDASYRSALAELNERIASNRDQADSMTRQRDALGLVPLRDRESLLAWWDAATIEDQRAALAQSLYRVTVNPAQVRGGNKFDTERIELRWRWDLYARASTAEWENLTDEEKSEALRESADLAAC